MATVYGQRIIDAGALGGTSGVAPAFPFLAMRHGEETRSPAPRVFDRVVELWSYDTPRDYTRTERGLRAVQAALEAAVGHRTEVQGVAWWLIATRYEGTSRDLEDDVVRASVKYSTFRLIGNTDQ